MKRHPSVENLFAAAALLTTVTLTAGTSSPAAASTTWRFTVSVAMAQAVADAEGGSAAARSKVLSQLRTVDARFNAPGVFRGTFDFHVVKFAVYTDATDAELAAPHPGSQLKLIYAEEQCPGGWYGRSQAIMHCWDVARGGSFSSDATDGLVHEFGHFREAIDEYALDVTDPANNPINGQTYAPPTSIMKYPYGVRRWDPYTVGVINRARTTVNAAGPALVSKFFPPTMQVQAVSAKGTVLKGAAVSLFPVRWFSHSVSGTAELAGKTNALGAYRFPRNPFGPGTVGPWDVAFPNFLVRVTSGGRVGYAWLPMITVGNAYFRHPHKAYTLKISAR